MRSRFSHPINLSLIVSSIVWSVSGATASGSNPDEHLRDRSRHRLQHQNERSLESVVPMTVMSERRHTNSVTLYCPPSC
jgi:hypothetical protein